MAGLAIRFTRIELNPALEHVGVLKNVIEHSVFRARGFTDVIETESEVAGNRPGVRVSVLHLHTGGRSFWRVVIGVADGGFNPAKQAVDEVFDAINALKFL